MSRVVALLTALCAAGASPAWAAHHPLPDARPHPAAAPSRGGSDHGRSREEVRARVVTIARRHLGERFRGDCTGFVRRVYAEAGVPLAARRTSGSGSESIYRALAPVRRPRPGDLAFFHRTHDRERPGPGANLFTHVALVESVRGPRVSLIHRGGTGVRRFAMNLSRPADPDENGAVRRRRPGDRPRLRYLAGELFAGYASAFREPERHARSRRTHP